MYLDSAIIVKLLVRESDSAWFDRHTRGHEFWSSELAVAEVNSAIFTRERSGKLSPRERKAALAGFESLQEDDVLRFHPLNTAVVRQAAGLLGACHPEVALRSLDAIHLATAILHPRGPLCTNDAKLRAAAGRMGVTCFPADISEIETD